MRPLLCMFVVLIPVAGGIGCAPTLETRVARLNSVLANAPSWSEAQYDDAKAERLMEALLAVCNSGDNEAIRAIHATIREPHDLDSDERHFRHEGKLYLLNRMFFNVPEDRNPSGFGGWWVAPQDRLPIVRDGDKWKLVGRLIGYKGVGYSADLEFDHLNHKYGIREEFRRKITTEVAATPPPPELLGLAITVVRDGNADVRAGGIEAYLEQYGDAGWLRGLQDCRDARSVAAHKLESGWDVVRVKDVFAHYYGVRRKYGTDRFSIFATVEERDRMIDAFVAEVREHAAAR